MTQPREVHALSKNNGDLPRWVTYVARTHCGLEMIRMANVCGPPASRPISTCWDRSCSQAVRHGPPDVTNTPTSVKTAPRRTNAREVQTNVCR